MFYIYIGLAWFWAGVCVLVTGEISKPRKHKSILDRLVAYYSVIMMWPVIPIVCIYVLLIDDESTS